MGYVLRGSDKKGTAKDAMSFKEESLASKS